MATSSGRSLFAVSDLHGFREEAHTALVDAGLIDFLCNWRMRDSTLVVIGDSIDRGPHSRQLVDDLIRWQRQAPAFGSNVELLLGNHEAMMLMGPTNKSAGDLWMQDNVGGQDTLDSYGIIHSGRYAKYQTVDILKVHKDFYLGLKSYHVQDDTLFVHAGTPPNTRIASLAHSQNHLWVMPKDFVNIDPHFLRLNFGVGRVVFGHCIFAHQVKSFQDGVYLGIDTGSCIPEGCVTVVKLSQNLGFEVVGTS